MILFFGSPCYFPEIYSFFKFSKAKFIAISWLAMIINSQEDFIAYDNYGNHYEYFYLLKNSKILYFLGVKSEFFISWLIVLSVG